MNSATAACTKAAVLRALASSALWLLCAQPAQAVLGEAAATIHADQMRFHGARHVATALRYQVHHIDLADGGVVRQFLAPSGQVFAVTWRGHLKPQLQPLLGQYFNGYSQAKQRNAPTRGFSRNSVVQSGDVVVSEGFHLGQFVGQAYVRHLVPVGVDVGALR